MGNVCSSCLHRLTLKAHAHSSSSASAGAKVVDANSSLEQPELDPTKWLLTPDEIVSSRGGVQRRELSNATSGNDVVLFPSSDAFFASVFDDMEATLSSDDAIWIAGWSMNTKVPLVLSGSKANSDATTLESIVERAVIQRGVHVRVLLWANVSQYDECIQSRDWLNALAPEHTATTSTSGTCVCLFDDRLPHHSSSHHQKLIVIQRKHHLVAYVGGLDITFDRWDSLQHNQAALRVERGVFKDTQGWIDAAMRLEGPASRDVAATFASRWNASNAPCINLDDTLLRFRNPADVSKVVLPATIAAVSPSYTSSGDTPSAHVQIVRTYSPHNASVLYPELAPKGELSLLHARIKAIQTATNFVFIEDQYFFYMPQLLTALLKALPRLLRVIVVVQRPTETRQARVAGYEKLVFQMAHPLLSAFPDKVKIYSTKQARGLYVHSKVLLVDDVFVSIGSSNWNRRSTTSDSEIAASVVGDAAEAVALPKDAQVRVGRLVRRFRLQKFSELTGLDATELDKLGFLESCDALERATTDPAAVLDALPADLKWEFVAFPPSYSLHVVDPDDVNGHRDD